MRSSRQPHHLDRVATATASLWCKLAGAAKSPKGLNPGFYQQLGVGF